MTKSTLFVQLNTLDELISEYRVADLRRIAKGKDTPAKILELLVSHPDRGVREEVFANNNTPESILTEAVIATIKFSLGDAYWKHGYPPLVHAVETRSNLSRELQEILADHPILKSSFAVNPSADYDLLQKLADEEVERPRGLSDSFAVNKAVKKDILLKLYGTNNANIWNSIAANSKLPADVLSAMYANDPETVRTASLRWKIARNTAASPELLARMAEDHPELRSEIARNSSISTELRTHFLMEGNFHEKDSVVDNRKTTAADVTAMVRSGNLDSIKAAAHSRKLTGDVIREISDKALADDSEYGKAVFLTLAHSPAYLYAMKQDPNFHTENQIHPFTH